MTTADIGLLRRLILSMTNTLPAGLWRFVRSDYTFANPQNPWAAEASRSYANLNVSLPGQDFIAIKLGDVNNSWTPSSVAGASAPPRGGLALQRLSAAAAKTVRFQLGHRTVNPGETLTAPISVAAFKSVTTVQFTLRWDPEVLRYNTTGDYGLSGLGAGNFGTDLTQGGKLTFSWDDPGGTGVTLTDGSVVCSVTFGVIGGNGTSSTVTLSDDPTAREVTVNYEAAEFVGEYGLITVGAAAAGPQITRQPEGRRVNPGATVQISVAASGTGLTCQWFKNGVTLSDGGNVNGASTLTLTLTGVQAADVGEYRVQLRTAGGSVTSEPANLAVNQLPTVRLVSPTPNARYSLPATIELTATASDLDGTVTKVEFYQGSTKLGEDTSSPFAYSWPNVAAGVYSLTARSIDNEAASRASDAVTVTVAPPSGADLFSPWQHRDFGAVGRPGTVTLTGDVFTVQASGADIWGTADAFHLVYQPMNGDGELAARGASLQNTDPWAKAGVMIRETLESGARHAFMAVSPGNGTAFQRRPVTNAVTAHNNAALNTATFDNLKLVLAQPDAPRLAVEPESGGYFVGSTATLTVLALGASPFRYQWKKNGADLTEGGRITGTRSPILVMANLQLADAGAYTVVVGNSFGIETSQPANLAVGALICEKYTGISGSTLADLTNHIRFINHQPDVITNWFGFEGPRDTADDYGLRVYGFLYPPVTGDHVFYVASDDASQLWLSTDEDPAHKKLVSEVTGWTGFREFTVFPSQKSAPRRLEAGRRYYMEALSKEGGGGDHLSVAWQLPGQSKIEVIQDQYFTSPISISPPRFTSVRIEAGELVLTWVEGKPPFVVETSSDLVLGSWIPLFSTQKRSAKIRMTPGQAFFRLSAGP